MMRKKRFYQRGVLFAAVVAAASVSGCGNAAKDAPSSVNGAESEPDGSQDPAKNGQSPFGKDLGALSAGDLLKYDGEKVAKARMESLFMQECL